MSKFKVWLRQGAADCKVRVEGANNAPLLRERLKAKGVTSTEPISLAGGKQCIFHAHCPQNVTAEGLQMYFASIPEVELMLDPA